MHTSYTHVIHNLHEHRLTNTCQALDEGKFRLQRLNFKHYITYTQGQPLNISFECIIKIYHLIDINNSFNIGAVAVVVQISG